MYVGQEQDADVPVHARERANERVHVRGTASLSSGKDDAGGVGRGAGGSRMYDGCVFGCDAQHPSHIGY